MSNITFATGLWDLKRSNLNEHFRREFFDTYVPQLRQLLSTGLQFVVFGDENIKDVVSEYSNAKFVLFKIDEFRDSHEFEEIQRIRTSPYWYDQPDAQWLKDAPQAALKYYVPLTFEKIHFVQRASKLNLFNSEKFYWLDVGAPRDNELELINTLSSKLIKYDKFIFLFTIYNHNSEIHGFRRDVIHKMCDVPYVSIIGKGMFLGGPIDQIDNMVYLHDKYITEMVEANCLGTEECIFTILCHRHPELMTTIFLPTGNYHFLKYVR